jgi:hypothetical protein
MRGWITLGSATSLAALCLACCFLPAGGGSGSASGPAPPSPTPTLDELEDRLDPGAPWGATPGDLELARAVWELLPHPEDGVAVSVVPGAAPHVRVLVEIFDDGASGLADLDDAERNALMTTLAALVRGRMPTASICVALRGTVFWGGMYAESPGAVPTYETGFAVEDTHIEGCLLGPPH